MEDFWKDLLEEFAVKSASSNILPKKACLHKFAFQKSQPKPKGPAVFAAGVGNPPAPGLLARVQGRVQDPGQIWPILGLERPPRIRRGCTACCPLHRLFRANTPLRRSKTPPRRPKTPPRRPKMAQDGPRRAQEASKMPQDASKMAQVADFARFWDPKMEPCCLNLRGRR